MHKVIVICPEKCTGCRFCEIACSFAHERKFNPSHSRIKVVKWSNEGIDVPITCQQCEDAPCEFICPVNAIRRDVNMGALIINHDSCIGCRMCMSVCPYGAIRFYDGWLHKCDLCGGDPACVKFCEPRAIQYTDANTASLVRTREAALKLHQLVDQEVSFERLGR